MWGAVRDTADLRTCRIEVRALAACPRPPQKTGTGERDIAVQLGDVTVAPGQWLAADGDGIVVADAALV